MQVLSAAEAISPAINRTKQFLFQPFRLGTFLKLCLVGVLTEGFGGNFNYSNGNYSHSHHGASPTPLTPVSYEPLRLTPQWLTPEWIAAIVAIAILVIGLSIVIFYLITRLRFALFHCLVYQTREIRPGWRIYREQAWRFFLLNLVAGLAFFVAAVLILLPFILGFFRFFRAAQPGGNFDFAGFFALFLPLIPIILLLVLAGIALDVILRDLMLPHIALENASVGAAWAAARARMAAEKGRFCLYGLFRVLLPLAAYVGVLVVLAIPLILVFGALVLSVVGLHALAASASAVSFFLLTAGQAALVVAGIAGAILIALCVGGPLSIWIRHYALLFYGGRYQALGDLLFPAPPLPPATIAGAPWIS